MSSLLSLLAVAEPVSLTLEELLSLLAQASEARRWVAVCMGLVLGALLVFLSVEGVRKLVIRWLPPAWGEWLRKDRAGVLLSALAGQLGALVVAAAGGQPVTVAMLLGVLSSLLASGGKSWGRKGSRKATPAPKPSQGLSE